MVLGGVEWCVVLVLAHLFSQEESHERTTARSLDLSSSTSFSCALQAEAVLMMWTTTMFCAHTGNVRESLARAARQRMHTRWRCKHARTHAACQRACARVRARATVRCERGEADESVRADLESNADVEQWRLNRSVRIRRRRTRATSAIGSVSTSALGHAQARRARGLVHTVLAFTVSFFVSSGKKPPAKNGGRHTVPGTVAASSRARRRARRRGA